MNTRRILSLLSVFALVFAMIVPAVRAETLEGTATIDGDTITVTATGHNFSEDGITTLRIIGSDWNNLDNVSSDDVDENEDDDSFDIDVSDADIDDDKIYSISFATEGWESGYALLYQDANVVEVSATVLPVLTMTVEGGDINFGNLDIGQWNEADTQTTVSVNSNASDGFVVQAHYSDLETADQDHDMPLILTTSDWEDSDQVENEGNVIDEENYQSEQIEQKVWYHANPAENQAAG